MSATELDRGRRCLQTIPLFLVTVVFAFHCYILVSQLASHPTVSSFTLNDHIPPRMPAVTICSAAPFPAKILLQLGINSSCETLDECSQILQELDGLQEDFSLQDLWNTSLLPLPNYVESSSIHGVETTYQMDYNAWPHWKVSNTVFGPCWTLTPPALKAGYTIKPLSVEVVSQIPCSKFLMASQYAHLPRNVFSNCEEVGKFCNTTCAEEKLAFVLSEHYKNLLVFLHSPNEHPTIVDDASIINMDNIFYDDVNFHTWISLRKMHMLKSSGCISDPDYSFSECLWLCYQSSFGKELNCMPFSDNAHLQNISCVHQFLQFRTQMLSNLHTTLKDRQIEKCKKQCKASCRYFKYTFHTEELAGPYYSIFEKRKTYSIKIQFSAPYFESVIEEEIYSTSKFLSELGGTLGLYFGTGIYTLYKIMYTIIMRSSSWWCRKSNHQTSTENTRMQMIRHSPNKSFIKDIWMMSGTCFCLLAFVVHSIQLTMNYLQYPTVFITNLVEAPPPFPALTLCPDVLFNFSTLLQYGLDPLADKDIMEISRLNEHCNRQLFIPKLVNTLPGLWESNVTIDYIWNTTRSLNSFVKTFFYNNIQCHGHVERILTTLGKCYMFTPPEDDMIISLINIDLLEPSNYNLQERKLLANYYNTRKSNYYNISLLLHPSHTTPLILGEASYLYQYHKAVLALTVHGTFVKRVSTPKASCRDPPYSKTKCIDMCYLQRASREVGCRLPYLIDSALPLCNTSSQYAKSFKGAAFNPTPKMKHRCKKLCKSECKQIYYSIQPQQSFEVSRDVPGIQISQPLSTSFELSEQMKTSLLSYLIELGGIMGLYLGMSIMDFKSFFAFGVGKVMKYVKILNSHKVPAASHCFKFMHTMWWLIMSALLLMFSLTRLEEYFVTPKVYTKFSQQPTASDFFPGVTLCRWPPFNMTSLATRGIDIDVSKFCFQGMLSFEYECKVPFNIFNEIPGLENVSIDKIWEDTHWNLSDLLHSYSIDGNHYMVESTKSPHWKVITTSLNRCFSFIPPDGSNEVSQLDLQLSRTGYSSNFFFEELPSISSFLEYIMSSHLYRVHNLIRIHSPFDQPLINDVDLGFPIYLSDPKEHYLFTAVLTEVSRLQGMHQKCRGGNYSHFNCIQDCLLNAIVSQWNCKLPFINQSSVNYCNSKDYAGFPKYNDKVAPKLHNYTEVKAACELGCPISCRVYSYALSFKRRNFEALSPKLHSLVTVKVDRSNHEVFEEVLALSFVSLVSEVGGMAGILTGMSLLALVRLLLAAIGRLLNHFTNH